MTFRVSFLNYNVSDVTGSKFRIGICRTNKEINIIGSCFTLSKKYVSYTADQNKIKNDKNRIGGVSGVVDRGFDLRSGQTKDYTIGICCFSAKHAAIRRMNID